MKADEIENILEFRFPEKWKDIHSTGVMEWMELECDCEPLFFEDIPKKSEEL